MTTHTRRSPSAILVDQPEAADSLCPHWSITARISNDRSGTSSVTFVQPAKLLHNPAMYAPSLIETSPWPNR
ncbi:MAG TPA: hypothetical protein VEY08_16610 [Chloroflexia bacterium]|nr:hypothetical protein [Chloroflexia bacterium]